MAIAVLAASCGDAGTPTTVAGLEIPDTPAGTQLAWLIDTINDGDFDESALAERFSDAVLAEAPLGDLMAVMEELAEVPGDVFVDGYVVPPTANDVIAILGSSDSESLTEVQLSVASAPPHRIEGLVFGPPGPLRLDEPPQSWGELEGILVDLADEVGIIVADVSDGDCLVIHERDAEMALPVGSVANIYILAAVAAAVGSTDLDWGDTLAMSDDLRSLPPGVTQNANAGDELTIADWAANMVVLADNTAADHLASLVGRSLVESSMPALGHASPDLNHPFLLTREAFALRHQVSLEELEQYVADLAEDRRTFLDGLEPIDLTGVDPGPAPIHPFAIGWFASPADLCRGLLVVDALAEEEDMEPVGQILELSGANLGVDAATWPNVRAVGSNQPGLLALAALLERDDGRRFMLFIGMANEVDPLDARTGLLVIGAAVDLLAATG